MNGSFLINENSITESKEYFANWCAENPNTRLYIVSAQGGLFVTNTDAIKSPEYDYRDYSKSMFVPINFIEHPDGDISHGNYMAPLSSVSANKEWAEGESVIRRITRPGNDH